MYKHVEEKLREDIEKGEYVDLGTSTKIEKVTKTKSNQQLNDLRPNSLHGPNLVKSIQSMNNVPSQDYLQTSSSIYIPNDLVEAENGALLESPLS